MTWWEYVQEVSNGAMASEIARKVGLSQPSVSGWKSAVPKPTTAAAFARAYGRPVLEAFVAAGFLTPEDARQRPASRPQLSEVPNQDLMREMERRINRSNRQDPKTSHDGHREKPTYRVFTGFDI